MEIDRRKPFDYRKAPFPWFGGKSRAAPIVWRALGDVANYVEPFFGGGAVLLRRPHPPNRPYHSETINDMDCFVANFWRAIQFAPQETAQHASWPVSEADLHARHLALLEWRAEGGAERIMGSWDYYDARIAGWWAWGVSCWIGSGFASGKGPWVRDPETGKIVKRDGAGLKRQRPHLSTDGQGCTHPALREPGLAVNRTMPHLGNGGEGCNNPTLREPGLGIHRTRPHLTSNGNGCNHPSLRAPGIALPHAEADIETLIEADYLETGGFHPIVMPQLRRWFDYLGARLRHVRVLCGDWSRCLTLSAVKTLPVRQGNGAAGIFLDPPYSRMVRSDDLYTTDTNPADQVRAWCLEHGDDPDLRIVLAGFDTEHADLEQYGWRCIEWFDGGFLTGGYGNISGEHQQHRERLWLSPHCLPIHAESRQRGRQMDLFGADGGLGVER